MKVDNKGIMGITKIQKNLYKTILHKVKATIFTR